MPCLVTRLCLTAIPWTVAARLLCPWGFFKQEYRSGLLRCPPPGDLPNPGIEPRSTTLWADSLPAEPPGKPWRRVRHAKCQAGIKISGTNINNLRYADDTTLMAESEEEPKSLLIKVKEESEIYSLNLNIQKSMIMAFSPMWKKVSRGLSRVEAGHPGVRRLVQVTSGGFSWWL